MLAEALTWIGYFRQLARMFDRAGFEPHVLHRVGDPTMMCNLVSEGVGVGLATRGSIDANRSDIAIVPLADRDAKVEQSMIWRADNDSRQLFNFMEFLKVECDTSIRAAR